MASLAPSLTPAHENFLRDLFPDDGCVLAPEMVAPFGSDASGLRAMPWAAVRPERTGQVQELLRWAQRERIPIIPRARGTGRVGNAVPVRGGVVVSMLRMNRVLDISDSDFVAVVQPGVITGELQDLCAAKKLMFPPDPASVRFSTVGGNVSTCAGGLKAVKYGVTRDWVLGHEAVIPGGSVIRVGGRSHKDVVGLDLIRLFCGSAGKLGLLTQLTFKLIPLPEANASVLVGFSSLRNAMEAAQAVFQSGILPCACEFMDSVTLSALKLAGHELVPKTAQAALLYRVDGSEAAVRAESKKLRETLAAFDPCVLETGEGPEQERLWDVRRGISPASHLIRPDKLAEDISVPRGRVGEAIEGCHAIGARHNVSVMCFGHLGDGNIHVGVLHNGSWPEEVKAAEQAVQEIFTLAVSLGGTISGEHGTGLTKKAYVSRQLGQEEMRLMDAIRRQFDPYGIMNPGKGW